MMHRTRRSPACNAINPAEGFQGHPALPRAASASRRRTPTLGGTGPMTMLAFPGRRQGRDPEHRLQALRRRFAKVSRRIEHARRIRRWRRRVVSAAPAIVLLASLLGGLFWASPWPPLPTVRHIAAVPNCAAARAVGLAPARRGQPGYWPQHDRDRDGWACEPWP